MKKTIDYLFEMQLHYAINNPSSSLAERIGEGKFKKMNEEAPNDFFESFRRAGFPMELINSLASQNFEENVKNKMTPIESPSSMILINNLDKYVTEELRFHKITYPNDIVIGSVPISSVNGCVFKSPNDGYVIAINDGIFTFFNLLAKVVSSFISVTQNEKTGMLEYNTAKESIDFNIKNNKEGHSRFLDLMNAYLIQGDANYAKPYIEPHFKSHLTSINRDTAELFLLSHEYGHIVAGHTEINKSELKIHIKNEDLETHLVNWVLEAQADSIAANLVISHNRRKKIRFASFIYGNRVFLFWD